MKSVACASSGFDMSFFWVKKAKIMHHVFAVLPGWAYISAFPNEVFTQRKVLSTLPIKSLL